MTKDKLILLIQSVLCVLLAVLLIGAVLGIYLNGTAAHAADPLKWIFTREIVAERLRYIAPVLFAGIALTVAGLILKVKDEKGLRPVKGGRVENKAQNGKTLRTVLLIAAAVLIVAGIFNGSARDVFGKAVKICTECVGLG